MILLGNVYKTAEEIGIFALLRESVYDTVLDYVPFGDTGKGF